MLACRHEIFFPLLKNTGCNILYFIYTEQVAKKGNVSGMSLTLLTDISCSVSDLEARILVSSGCDFL